MYQEGHLHTCTFIAFESPRDLSQKEKLEANVETHHVCLGPRLNMEILQCVKNRLVQASFVSF